MPGSFLAASLCPLNNFYVLFIVARPSPRAPTPPILDPLLIFIKEPLKIHRDMGRETELQETYRLPLAEQGDPAIRGRRCFLEQTPSLHILTILPLLRGFLQRKRLLGDDQRVPRRPRGEWTLQLSVFRPVEKLQAPSPGRIQRVKQERCSPGCGLVSSPVNAQLNTQTEVLGKEASGSVSWALVPSRALATM